jgi:hypothetical protein
MKLPRKVFALRGALLTLAAALAPAGALAQQDNRVPAAFLGGFILIFWLFFLAMYVYTALALSTIAQKTNTENGWLAWIPIANVFLMCNIAKKPVWWIILCLIPLVNIVIFILLWMGIAEARNKPSWWGIMVIVPVMNLIMPGYLAWTD